MLWSRSLRDERDLGEIYPGCMLESFSSAVSGFCLVFAASAYSRRCVGHTENSRRSREKPLVPREGEILSNLVSQRSRRDKRDLTEIKKDLGRDDGDLAKITHSISPRIFVVVSPARNI